MFDYGSLKLATEARTPFDDKTNTYDMRKQKVTDYKKNSRVYLPRAQTAEQEMKI